MTFFTLFKTEERKIALCHGQFIIIKLLNKSHHSQTMCASSTATQ